MPRVGGEAPRADAALGDAREVDAPRRERGGGLSLRVGFDLGARAYEMARVSAGSQGQGRASRCTALISRSIYIYGQNAFKDPGGRKRTISVPSPERPSRLGFGGVEGLLNFLSLVFGL